MPLRIVVKVRRRAVRCSPAGRSDRLPGRALLLVVFASRDGQDATWRTDLLQHETERAVQRRHSPGRRVARAQPRTVHHHHSRPDRRTHVSASQILNQLFCQKLF